MGKPFQKPFSYSFFFAGLGLILVNAAVFALCAVFPRLRLYLGLCPAYLIKYRMYWQPLTYMFVHGGLPHFFSNMIGLLFFGLTLERRLGSKEFLLLYFSCGIASGLFSTAVYALTGRYGVILIGASGALYAVMLAYAVCFPRANIYIWGVLPVPSPLMVILYAGIEFFSQFSGAASGVAHMTHLFGFAAAWIYIVVRTGRSPVKIWKDAYR